MLKQIEHLNLIVSGTFVALRSFAKHHRASSSRWHRPSRRSHREFVSKLAPGVEMISGAQSTRRGFTNYSWMNGIYFLRSDKRECISLKQAANIVRQIGIDLARLV